MAVDRVIQALRRAEYRQSLLAFVKQAFPIIQHCDYVHGRHVDVTVNHLEALAKKRIRRLLVNLPPSSSKSSICNVLYPAWIWTWWPECRVQSFAYNETLAVRDQVMCRELIGSEWYQRLFPNVRVKFNQDQQKFFGLTAGGERRIATPGGGISTGNHPDLVICDDLMSRDQSESPRERAKVIEWYFETMSTRGMGRDVLHCLAMQRLHVDDLPGEVIRRIKATKAAGKKSPWYHVQLPMRYDPEITMEDRGYGGDWRTKPGELMFPELLTEERVAQAELDLGPHGTRCQMQQDPRRRDGNLFKVTRLQIIDREDLPEISRFQQLVRFWDLAGTDERDNKDACYTAGVLMGRIDDKYYVIDVFRKQLGGDEVEDAMATISAMDEQEYGRGVPLVRFEREPGSSGKRVAEQLCKRLRKYLVQDIKPEGKKEVRADPFAAAVSRYEVYVVSDKWTSEYIEELSQFPGGKFKDQVDASSGAYLEFDAPGTGKKRLSVAPVRLEGEFPEYGDSHPCMSEGCKRPAFGEEHQGYCCDCCYQASEAGEEPGKHSVRCNGKNNDFMVRSRASSCTSECLQ